MRQGWVGRLCEGHLSDWCTVGTLCGRCGRMWQCPSVVDNVMFLMLNEDKDLEIRTPQTTHPTKKTQEEAFETKKLKQNKNNNYLSRQIPLHLHASSPATVIWLHVWPLHQQVPTYWIDLAHGFMCGFECKRMCAGGTSSSVPPLRPHPSDIMTDYATWPGENLRLTVPCYLSLRSALETTRDSRRAFRESTAASLCIPSI